MIAIAEQEIKELDEFIYLGGSMAADLKIRLSKLKLVVPRSYLRRSVAPLTNLRLSKTLSRIVKPLFYRDQGTCPLNVRVSPQMEVGMGFVNN